jgi:O-antigen ligase
MISRQLPYYTILATVFLTVLGSVSLYQVGPIHFRPYQIPLLLSAAGFFVQLLRHKQKFLLPAPLKVLLLFFVTIAASLWVSQYPAVTIKQAILLGLYVMTCFLIANACDTEKKLIWLHKVIVFSCLTACVYGLIIFILTNLSGVAKEGGYWYTRPKSFFVEPNEFGLYLTFAFGYIFSEFYAGTKIIKRYILWMIFLLFFLLIMPNMSRGSWLGCIATIITVIFYQHKTKLQKITIFRLAKITVLIALLSTLPLWLWSKVIPVRETVTVTNVAVPKTVANVVTSRVISLPTGQDSTYQKRLKYSQNAVDVLRQHPLTGIGFGNVFTTLEGGLQENKSDFHGIPAIGTATSSNFLVDICAETGIPGILIFVLFLILLLKKGLDGIKTAADNETLTVLIGAMGSCVGLMVNGLTYPILLLPFFWISAGMLSTPISRR